MEPQIVSDQRLEQKLTFAAGVLLLASGIFHVLVWQLEGGSLSGPVSWRKPILFGFSAGATVISVAWVVGKMKRRTGDLALLIGFSFAMLMEVGLITLQQWRGVASHFNRSTPFDATVRAWIELLILLATIVIAELTRRSAYARHLRGVRDSTFGGSESCCSPSLRC